MVTIFIFDGTTLKTSNNFVRFFKRSNVMTHTNKHAGKSTGNLAEVYRYLFQRRVSFDFLKLFLYFVKDYIYQPLPLLSFLLI